MTGFRTALTRTINKYARDKGILKEKDVNLTNDDVVEWITCVISIKLEDPQFEWQTKAKLGSSEARWAVDWVFAEKFMEFLEENPSSAKKVIEKYLYERKTPERDDVVKALKVKPKLLERKKLLPKLLDKIIEHVNKFY